MPEYHYKVKRDGEIVENTVQAHDRFALAEDLRKGGQEVISIQEVAGPKKWSMTRINEMLSRVKLRELVVFTRNLSAMLDAGLSLSRALSILERQTDNPKLKKILSSIQADIASGATLSGALKKFPKTFPPLFISMVHAGEESGGLSAALKVVGTQLEKNYTLKKKIKGAMLYPSIVLSAMVLIGILMMIYVVPTLTETFSELDADLPAATQMIITASDIMSEYTFLVLGGGIAFIIGLIYFKRTRLGTRIFHFGILHMPIVSPLAKQTNAAYTARTLSSLLSSGVDVVESIKISREVVQNVYFKDVLEKAAKGVQKGSPIHKAFSENTKLYPLLVGEMMEVGEETGKLSEMLERLADFYEDEVQTATKDMSTIIEPILMIVIASGVGFFAMAMITPMYSLSQSF